MFEVSWEYTAGQAWPLLVRAAEEGRLLQYADIERHIDLQPLSVLHVLDLIQYFCRTEHLPPLTTIVTGKLKGAGNIACAARDPKALEAAQMSVFAYDWNLVCNPYRAFEPDDTSESLARRIISDTSEIQAVYQKVQLWGSARSVFRNAIFSLYNGRCAFCGLTFEDALEATHIISWQRAAGEQRIDPRNGLLLCSSHRRLFEAGSLAVNTAYVIVYYDASMQDGPYTELDFDLTVGLHGRRINLPTDERFWPRMEWLEARNHLDAWE